MSVWSVCTVQIENWCMVIPSRWWKIDFAALVSGSVCLPQFKDSQQVRVQIMRSEVRGQIMRSEVRGQIMKSEVRGQIIWGQGERSCNEVRGERSENMRSEVRCHAEWGKRSDNEVVWVSWQWLLLLQSVYPSSQVMKSIVRIQDQCESLRQSFQAKTLSSMEAKIHKPTHRYADIYSGHVLTCTYIYSDMYLQACRHVLTSTQTCTYRYFNMYLQVPRHVLTGIPRYAFTDTQTYTHRH